MKSNCVAMMSNIDMKYIFVLIIVGASDRILSRTCTFEIHTWHADIDNGVVVDAAYVYCVIAFT